MADTFLTDKEIATLTNGLKARCRALRKSGSAQGKQRMGRTICPVRVKFPHTFAIRGFDSLHPLHLSPRQISVFPCESAARPSTDGRGIGLGFTFLLHRFCGVRHA
jgi:hypothetical protein